MAADLEADIEDFGEDDWEQAEAEGAEKTGTPTNQNADASAQQQPTAPAVGGGPSGGGPSDASARVSDSELMDATSSNAASQQGSEAGDHAPSSGHAVSQPVSIPTSSAQASGSAQPRDMNRTPSPNGAQAHEGPLTPRNDAGPWVFDGSAAGSRAGSTSGPSGRDAAANTEGDSGNMRSLDATTEMDVDREA